MAIHYTRPYLGYRYWYTERAIALEAALNINITLDLTRVKILLMFLVICVDLIAKVFLRIYRKQRLKGGETCTMVYIYASSPIPFL